MFRARLSKTMFVLYLRLLFVALPMIFTAAHRNMLPVSSYEAEIKFSLPATKQLTNNFFRRCVACPAFFFVSVYRQTRTCVPCQKWM